MFYYSQNSYIVSILFYNFIQFIILLYTFLVISFARYREYIICLISFSKFLDVLPASTCASAIGNLSRMCFEANIFSRVAKSEGRPSPFVAFIENIPLLKALRVNSRPS